MLSLHGPQSGIEAERKRDGFKLYAADTGLLISQAPDEHGRMPEELYARLLHGKPDVNRGMLTENVVAQMLTAAGHKLYYYANSDREDAGSRMELDFLIAKASPTNQHNISPIEVKSGKRYTLTWLNKFRDKFARQTDQSYVVHGGMYKRENGITYLPYYCVPWISYFRTSPVQRVGGRVLIRAYAIYMSEANHMYNNPNDPEIAKDLISLIKQAARKAERSERAHGPRVAASLYKEARSYKEKEEAQVKNPAPRKKRFLSKFDGS